MWWSLEAGFGTDAMSHPVNDLGRMLGRGLALAGMTVGMISGTGSAATLAEVGDAGDVPATAQSSAGVEPFGTPLDAITGTVANSSDQDMFEIYISDPSAFSATTTNAQTAIEDTMLYLFDENGLGVLANDDTSGTEFTSTLAAGSLTGSAGVYYIAVSLLFNSPLSATGDIFDVTELEATTDTISANGAGAGDPINGWDVFAFTDPGAYQINLTGTTFVPEPSAAVLLGLGLAGFAWRGRPS